MTWVPRFALRIGGEPLPKERPRAAQGRAFTPKRTRDAEKRVLDAFRAAYPDVDPLTGRLLVDVKFYRRTRRGVDLDNLAKLCLDALNGVAYRDDEQIDIRRIQPVRVSVVGDVDIVVHVENRHIRKI